jgi:hypothetical protein
VMTNCGCKEAFSCYHDVTVVQRYGSCSCILQIEL